jgi:hypothetical protein
MAQAWSSALLWQGYKHRWDYNHRVKRFGSYVHHVTDHGGPRKAIIGHTGASGWGDDELKFVDYYTHVEKAEGVWFQTGYWDVEIDCTRLQHNRFETTFTAPLDKTLRGLDDYAVVLNGFDLRAVTVADKLMDLDLEITDASPDESSISFTIRGHLQFDCRSLECLSDDLFKRERPEQTALRDEIKSLLSVIDLGDQLDTSSPESFFASLKNVAHEFGEIVEETTKERVLRRHLKKIKDAQPDVANEIGDYLRSVAHVKPLMQSEAMQDLSPRVTPYALRVHFLIVGGNADALNICRSFEMPKSQEYSWSLKKEAKAKDWGQANGRFTDHKTEFEHDVPALSRLSVSLKIDSEAHHHANQGACEAMHMMELNTAVHSPQRKNGSVDVALELFFKAWEKGMETGHVGSGGSLRMAGSASLSAEAILLQFDGRSEPKERVGTIEWGGIIDPELDNPESMEPREGIA